MTNYDFIEIGTSDFNTEIQKEKTNDNTYGISIEPIKKYLDNLPNKKNCIKLNCAISDHIGSIKIYYIEEDNIKKYNFPEYIRGCNSVNQYHPTVLRMITDLKLDPEKIFTFHDVRVIDFETLATENNVNECKFLKIDAEGHDCIILQSYIDYCIKIGKFIAKKIMFESNKLNDSKEINLILDKLQSNGYIISSDNTHDITLELSAHAVKFTHKIPKTYLKGYPAGFNPKKMPYKNTLDAAMDWCSKKSDCGGITYQYGRYEARKGNKAIFYDKLGSLASWVKK